METNDRFEGLVEEEGLNSRFGAREVDEFSVGGGFDCLLLAEERHNLSLLECAYIIGVSVMDL